MRTLLALLIVALSFSSTVYAHGDAQPQPIDTSSLEQLGEEWLDVNPYRGNEDAIKIGKAGYNSNCARCHGLGAVSGGIAPDLRELDEGDDGDEWWIYRLREGATRNGITYMPAFEGIISQEAMWAIRAWVETVDPE